MRDPVSSSDPYAILGLEAGSTMAEVKRAYRRLAKAYHPDSAGEAAVPRFLAIHAAYEAIRTGRPMATGRRGSAGSAAGGAAGQGGASGPAEPWRADPERARAARERARRATGARAGGPRQAPGAQAGSGARSSTGRASGTSGTPGSSGSASRAGSTGTSGAATGATGGTGAGGGRGSRRHVRKATMGSTSYDDARDPNDASWSGASWYGPSTGEYWIVNPREYADPRKHGPEYQSRARRPSDPPGPAELDADAPASETPEPEVREDIALGGAASTQAASSGPAPTGTASSGRPSSEAPFVDVEAAPPTADAAGRPRRPAWSPPARAGGAGERTWEAATTRAAIRAERGGGGLPASARDWLGTSADDPIRRLGIALVAWPPLGLAVAAVIGQATGCSVYSAACDGTEPLLPWLAQAGILGLLLLLPPAARVLAGGTIAILLALLPITAFLVSVGGSGAPQSGFALAFFLAVAWLAGVAWSATMLLRRPRASGAP